MLGVDTRSLLGVTLVAAVAGLAGAASASASVPEFESCLGDRGSSADGTCSPADGLAGEGAVAISPDNKSLYTTSANDHSLAIFDLDPQTGALTPAGCIEDSALGTGECDVQVAGLGSPRSVAVSPDGADVYVVGGSGIVHLRRDSDGGLTPTGCGSVAPCSAVAGIRGSAQLDVAPDGRVLYAVGSSSVLLYDVDPVDGDVTYRECVSADPDDFPPSEGVMVGCETYENGLWGARHLAISPDGKSVYVASDGGDDGHGANALVLLRPDLAGGGVESVTCLFAHSGFSFVACPDAPYGLNPTAIAVSPDGASVYMGTSWFDTDDELFSLARDPLTGTLTPLGCIGSADPDVFNECPTRVRGLTRPRAISVAPDGRSLYVGGSRALVGFERTSPSDLPTGSGCLRSARESIDVDCARTVPILPRAFTFGPNGLAYGRDDDALGVFRWSPEPSEPTPTPASDTDPPDTALRAAIKHRGRRAKLSFDSTEAGSTFSCRLDHHADAACSSPVRYRGLGPGRHRFRVVATDPAGNEDPIAATRLWHARERKR